MVHNLDGIKIVPDFQRVTLAKYMEDTNQPENVKFCTNWVQKFKAMKIWYSRKNGREKGKANIKASDLAGNSEKEAFSELCLHHEADRGLKRKPDELVAVCPSACFVVATLLQFQSKKRKKVAL